MTPLIAAGVRSARKAGHTPDYLRKRASVFCARAADYTTERTREAA